MKFIVGNLQTGRKDSANNGPQTITAALCAAKRDLGEFKGVKTKIRIWLPSEKQVYTEGTGGFSSPGGLMAINLLCQQNAFFQFSHQMKARVKIDGELI